MTRAHWIGAATAAIAFAGAPAAAQAADTIYGVTAANELTSFSSDAPEDVAPPRAISGLAAGEVIRGIDVRPATGAIYALGSTGQVYVLDPVTAAATPAFSPAVTLRGSNYGIDFNPTVDKLRLVSDGEDNQRLNPDTGATVAGTAADGGDGDITPAGDVVAAAYTNNVNGRQAGATTRLYTIDAGTNALNFQNPPNDGTQSTVGPLGVDVSAGASFDIPAAANVGYGAFEVGGSTGLHTVDLATGTATLVGPIGTSSPIVGIAAAKQDVPLLGLTAPAAGVQRLLTFASSAPRNTEAGQPIPVTATRVVSGLPAGVTLTGIDLRPADGRTYGFGTDGGVYVVDVDSGRATRTTSPAAQITGGAASFGVDFNPVPNRLRVVDDAEDNFRINPDQDGAAAPGVTVDGRIDPDSTLVGAAYSNAVPGALSTILSTIDLATDRLNVQSPPNDGTQVPGEPLGIDVGPETGYDIAPQDDAGFVAAQPAGATRSTLYRLEAGPRIAPLSGTTPIGTIGADATGFVVRGLTVAAPGTLGLVSATATATESAGTVGIAVARSSGVGVATVRYAVAPAEAGSAVQAAEGAITFAPGETLKEIPVALADDATPEAPQTATVTLARGAGGYRLGTTTTTLTVQDDDVAPTPGTTTTTPAPPATTIPGATVTIPGTTVTIPAPVPGIQPDRGRPVVLVVAPDRRLRTLRSQGIPIVVSTNEASRIDLQLRLGTRVLGTATAVATGPSVQRIRVRLTAAGRAALAGTRTLRLRTIARVTDVSGNVTEQARTSRAVGTRR